MKTFLLVMLIVLILTTAGELIFLKWVEGWERRAIESNRRIIDEERRTRSNRDDKEFEMWGG